MEQKLKKYKLNKSSYIYREGVRLYRIIALIDFSDVRAGDRGGYVQSEENLSQEGTCWIYNNAKAMGNSRVLDYAKMYDNAEIRDEALICDNAEMHDKSCMYEQSVMSGNSSMRNRAHISGDVKLYGNVQLSGVEHICGDAIIKENSDYMVFNALYSSGHYITWTRSNNMYKTHLQYLNGEELIEEAYKESKESGDRCKKMVEYIDSTMEQ